MYIHICVCVFVCVYVCIHIYIRDASLILCILRKRLIE